MSDMVGMGAAIAMGQTMAESLSKTTIDKHTPPPIPNVDSKKYYIALNNEQEGPYDIRTIKRYISDKKVDKDTLIWTEGLKDWVETDALLPEEFKATPPPLPKQ